MKLLIFDPGENTGWLFAEFDSIDATSFGVLQPEYLLGNVVDIRIGTSVRSHMGIAELFHIYDPDVVVYETFNMYPGKAKELSWNSFYPCEVIGIIKYLAEKNKCRIFGQAPSTKKYSGGLDEMWIMLRKKYPDGATEHSKDTFLHFKYFLRNNLKKVV